MKKTLRKLFTALLFVLSVSLVSAHGVQVTYCTLNTGFVRIYIEHWHGDQTVASLVNNGMSITTTYGSTTTTLNTDATAAINNTTLGNLPPGVSGITVLSSCSGSANQYNDWAIFDFAPASCGVPVNITLNSGNTVVLTEACSGLYPVTINATFQDNSPPVITAPDITVTSCLPVNVNFTATIVDACDPNPTASYSIASGSVFNPGTTQVTITATDNLNHTSTATFNVNVNPPALTINATSNTPCEGSTLNLSVTSVSGATYAWSGPNGFSSTAQNPSITNVQTTNSGTYNVTITVGAACVYYGSTTVTVLEYGKLPTVTTTPITNITATSASSGGTVAISCDAITARGIVWNTTGTPTLSDHLTTDGTGIGNYASGMTGLTNGTTYYVRAYATNSIGTSYGAQYSFVAHISYCTPAVSSNACYYMYITNVTTTGGTSNFNNSSACSSTSYTDYSGTYSVTQAQGSSVTMSFTSYGYGLNYSVWVDYNDDGTFAASEKVITTNNSSGSFNVSASFTIPVTATAGTKKMRVRSEYYGYSAPVDPCNAVYYGEAEDYALNVSGGAPDDPTSVSASVNPVCSGSSTTLTCNGAKGTVYWYTGSCGGTFAGTGNTLAVSPTANTTYYARNYDNGQYSTNCANIAVTVNSTPVIICPGDITQYNDANLCGAVITFNATASGIPTPVISYSTASGSTFPVGTTAVTATATNTCGSTTCTFNVKIIDNQLPDVITQPFTVQLDANGQAGITTTNIDNGSTDNCSIDSMSLDVTNFSCADVGANSVTLTVTDVNNNVSTATAIVTVEDNTAPNAICQNADVYLDASGSGSILIPASNSTLFFEDFSNDANGYYNNQSITNWSVTSDIDLANYVPGIPGKEIDLAGYTNSSIESTQSFNLSPGTYTISFQHLSNTYSDNSVQVIIGSVFNQTFLSSTSTIKSESESFTVTSAQTVTIKMNQLGTSDPGGSFIGQIKLTGQTPSYLTIENGSNDACGIASITSSVTTFNCSDVGANAVTLTVVDVHGNTSTCNSTVTVHDNIVPTVFTQNITVQLDASGQAGITTTNIDNGSYDNCSIASMTLDVSSFSCADVGANTVTLTVTDVNGNSNTATATVTVEDNIVPTVLTQNITVQLDANGQAGITTTNIDNGSTDNCSIANMSLDVTSFSCADVGANTVTLTVTDNNGNIATATATVTVEDNVAPAVVTKPITVQLGTTGQVSILPTDVDDGTTDACGFSLSLDITQFDCSNVGTNTVTLTATDVNGNSSSATAVVTVEDNIAATVLTQNITVQLDATGTVNITTGDIDNGSYDNCGIAGMSLDVSSFYCSNTGANTVTLTVSDDNGNVSSATATVTVEDNIAPVFATFPSNISVTAQRNDCSPIITWTEPTVTENCTYGVTSDHSSGDRFGVGTTTVTYTVTDASSNTSSQSFDVTVTPTPVVVTATQSDYNGNNISCNGLSDGWIDLTIEGGCLPYTINWSNAATSEDISNLSAGVYDVTVLDANGTQVSVTYTLTEPATLASTLTSYQYAGGWNISCYGLSDGNADLSVSGGTTPYSYLWNTTATTEDLSNLGASQYDVTVTDLNGCVTTNSITLSEPQPMTAGITSNTYIGGNNVSCYEFTDGNADLSAGGGTLPYNYAWNTTATTEDLTNIGAGYYEVTTTDANGCDITKGITLTQPDKLVADAGYDYNTEICFKDNIVLGSTPTATGGITPYNYQWLPSASLDNYTSANPLATPQATTLYELYLGDVNGCTDSSSVTVTVNPLPVVTLDTSGLDAFCNGVSLQANSSTSEHAYLWNTGDTTRVLYLSIDEDTAGIYSVIVQDQKGCISPIAATYKYDPQNLPSSYTILAFEEVKLGEEHIVESGSVGVMETKGEAKFGKKTKVNSSGSFVKAKKIKAHNTADITTRIYQPANVQLPVMQYYNVPSHSYSKVKVKKNKTVTINSNYVDVEVEEGGHAILNGTIFGEVEAKKGGSVTFNSTDIQIRELEIKDAKKHNRSYVNFADDTKVRVEEEIKMDKNVTVNEYNYQVVFYVGTQKTSSHSSGHHSSGHHSSGHHGSKKKGHSNKSSNKYHKGEVKLKGDGLVFNGSIYIPEGEIKIDGGGKHSYSYMTGFYIAKEIEAEAKRVVWNWHNCDTSVNVQYRIAEQTPDQELNEEGKMFMSTYPNPFSDVAFIEFGVTTDETTTIEVYDILGQKVATLLSENVEPENVHMVQFHGEDLSEGVYIVRLRHQNETVTKRIILSK